MWQQAQRLFDVVDRWVNDGAEQNSADLIAQVGKFRDRIVNVTKNKPKSRSPADTLKPGTSVQVDGLNVELDQALAMEAETISTAFDVHQMDALQIVLDGEMQLINFTTLPRGLLAVVCYYDYHRFLALTLQALLRLDPETVAEDVKTFIENSFVNVALFKHLLQVQSTFSVQSEFIRLSQPEINGLGGTKHQLLLRTIIDELSEAIGDCLYSLCGWTGDKAKDFAAELYPVLRSFPVAEKLGSGHLAAWTALIRLTSPEVLTRGNAASPVLNDMIREIRNETVWTDQSLCGTVQLACAVSLRSLAVSPTDHLNLVNVEVDVDRIVDRANQNHAFKFLRHAVLGSDFFTHNMSYIKVVDSLLKKLVANFPAKLLEIERDSEDELVQVEEINAKGQMVAAPNLFYATFLGCLSDLYFLIDSSRLSDVKKEELSTMSGNFSPGHSIELSRFLERSRLVCHPIHAVAYLEFERAVCRTQEVASFLFDVFARVPPDQDTYIGWEQFMSTLRIYEQRFRQQSSQQNIMGSHQPQQPPQVLEVPQHELAGLISWITLARKIAELDPDSAEQFIDNRAWSLIDCANGLISAPTPIQFKGALLSLLAALARRESGVMKIWQSMNAYQICRLGDNGALYGLQQELDERECAARRYDVSLGMVQLLNELFSHGTVPEYATPYIQYLTKSVISQMGNRSYEDVHQLWEIADHSLAAVYSLIRHGYTDARSVLQKDQHIQLLVQILNDTPVFRAICSILLEDCDGYMNPTAGLTHRLSQKTAFTAIKLLSLAISRHSQLRTAVRAANSDIIVANIQSMLLAALRNAECMLDVLFLYLDQVNDLPHHAYYAANILRELCGVRPSLQKTITELLKLRTRNGTGGVAMSAVAKVFDFSKIEYGIDDIIKSDLDATDAARCRGETARILLEIFCDAVDTDPATANVCFLLFGFQKSPQGALYANEYRRTGFHNIVQVLEHFKLEDPLSTPYSALVEPAFRLLKRLTSIDCAFSVEVLRHVRCNDFVEKILDSGNPLHCMNQFDQEEEPTHYALSRMIVGSILHLAAVEISTLLKSGHIDTPHRLYKKLFESVEQEGEEGNTNILFSILHSNRSIGATQVELVALDHFNSHKLQLISEDCKSTTSFGTPQYDIKNLHDLLKREIMSTQNENAIVLIVEKEMMKVLEYFTDLNSQLLLRGAVDSLVSGCTALLNVIALFSPVPFFSLESQLDLLSDAAFAVIEFTSTSTDKEALPLSTTLQRLVKTISLIVKEEHTEESDLRMIMGRILVPLMELMVLPIERPFQSKVALYESARLCLKTCSSPIAPKDAAAAPSDWLQETESTDRDDVILRAVDRLSYDLNQRIVTDTSDMTMELKIQPLLFLGDLLREDSNGSKKVASFFSKSGMPRCLVDTLTTLDIDWVALSRRDRRAQTEIKVFNSILMVLIRMSMTDPGWNALSQLGVLEVAARIPAVVKPPKEIFLNPKTVNEKGSPANAYSQAVDLVVHLCLTLCSKPKWKRLSFKALEVVRGLSELLSQLMRAELNCDLVSHAADLVYHIWECDEEAKKQMESEPVLNALRQLKTPKEPTPLPVDKKVDFVAPSLLKNLFPSIRI